MPDHAEQKSERPAAGPWALPTLNMHDYRPDPAAVAAALGRPVKDDAPDGRIPGGVQRRGR